MPSNHVMVKSRDVFVEKGSRALLKRQKQTSIVSYYRKATGRSFLPYLERISCSHHQKHLGKAWLEPSWTMLRELREKPSNVVAYHEKYRVRTNHPQHDCIRAIRMYLFKKKKVCCT
jgi:hypothetical protein